MDEYEYQNTKEKIAKRGRIMIWLGLIIGIAGIVLLVVGIMNNFTFAAVGGFTMVIGLAIAGFGMQFYFASKAGKISGYMARATGSSSKYTAEQVTDGIASGLKKHDMSIGGGGKEVVKIKCRNCGYLETEDAEFCSKCGQAV